MYIAPLVDENVTL